MTDQSPKHGLPPAATVRVTRVVVHPETGDLPVAELVREMARRWAGGERPPAEEFLARHPGFGQEPGAALKLIYVSSELEVEAVTRDLSRSGVFVNTQILDPIGTRCRLTFLIDGGPPLEVAGVVRRVVDKTSEGVGLGIELLELTASDHHWIDLVLARDEAKAAGIQPT